MDSSLRLLNAVQGGLVADAASMPVHWIYKNAQLLNILGASAATPEFFEPVSCPYYDEKKNPGHYGRGGQSPYGEQFVILMNAVAANKALVDDGPQLASAFVEATTSFNGYHDGAMKKVVANMAEGKNTWPDMGADDNQAHSLYKALLSVASCGAASTQVDLKRLETIVRFHQNNDTAFLSSVFFAGLLHSVVQGSNLTDAISDANTLLAAQPDSKEKTELTNILAFAMESTSLPPLDFLSACEVKFGTRGVTSVEEAKAADFIMALTCHNPCATARVLHIVVRAQSYEQGVRENLLVGGDNCSTAIGIGAILGSIFGVPANFLAQCPAAVATNVLPLIE
jgi:ADP-ribosylglycohydrolase